MESTGLARAALRACEPTETIRTRNAPAEARRKMAGLAAIR